MGGVYMVSGEWGVQVGNSRNTQCVCVRECGVSAGEWCGLGTHWRSGEWGMRQWGLWSEERCVE